MPKVGAESQASTFGISSAESSIAIEHSYFKIPAFGKPKTVSGHCTETHNRQLTYRIQ